ncbi:hypothetical protein DPMN_186660 [Dreissena polymorpha]|uniref:Uncharacterized protein n=1 Tax=Dreissena polymorpha TaxID=45954 RepID=A0A9D4I9S2_DREPO|nr:hypothetical protein DPMN_186660 [Dreissena polymorpha]
MYWKPMNLCRLLWPGNPRMCQVRRPVSVPSFPVTVMRKIRLWNRIWPIYPIIGVFRTNYHPEYVPEFDEIWQTCMARSAMHASSPRASLSAVVSGDSDAEYTLTGQ